MDPLDRRNTPGDPHNLARFVAAQQPVYPSVLAELGAGKKVGHWMWFIFPQVEGLGYTPLAEEFAIRSEAEARAYLHHPLLGARLRECATALLRIQGKSALQVLGTPDDLKLRSSMTLFAAVDAAEEEFHHVLDKYYGGAPDPLTTATLQRWRQAAGSSPLPPH